MFNPVSQLALVRSAIGFTGAVTEATGSAASALVHNAGASFKEIFAQSPSPADGSRPVCHDSSDRFEELRMKLVTAVQQALTHAGITLGQQPLELDVVAGQPVVVATEHPQQTTLEMVLQNDEVVSAAAAQLSALHFAGPQQEPLKITIR